MCDCYVDQSGTCCCCCCTKNSVRFWLILSILLSLAIIACSSIAINEANKDLIYCSADGSTYPYTNSGAYQCVNTCKNSCFIFDSSQSVPFVLCIIGGCLMLCQSIYWLGFSNIKNNPPAQSLRCPFWIVSIILLLGMFALFIFSFITVVGLVVLKVPMAINTVAGLLCFICQCSITHIIRVQYLPQFQNNVVMTVQSVPMNTIYYSSPQQQQQQSIPTTTMVVPTATRIPNQEEITQQ